MPAATENRTDLDLRVLAARSTPRATGVAKVPVREPVEIDFAAWLVTRMATMGLTTAELARRSSVNDSTITNLREGRAKPGIRVCRKLAVGLAISLPELLYVASLITEDERDRWGTAPGPALPPVIQEIMELLDPEREKPLTEKEGRMLQAALRRSLESYLDFLAELQQVRAEPRRR